MQNKISDLNNILFEQLHRLNDQSKKGELLTEEIERAKALTSVGAQVISNYRVQLDAVKMLADGGYIQPDQAKIVLGIENGKQ